LILLTVMFYWPILVGKGFLWNDFLEQNFVYRLFAAVSLKQGILPFWNPYVFSGLPFFADVQAAVLYPLNLALTPFASKDWLSPLLVEYQIILHIAMAGCFMYLLARDFGASRSGGLLAGVTFMFCGFFTTHIFHENLIHAAAWFPLAIVFFRRALERISLLYASLTALVLCIIFLCGYPQLMVHMYYWLAAYYLFGLIVRAREKTRLVPEVKRGVLFAALVILGIGMAAVQLLPTQELAKNSVRPHLSFSESCEGSLRPYRFVTLFAPNYFGRPQKSAYWGISDRDVNGGIHNYWETAVYAGTVSLAIAAIAPFVVRTPLTVFLSIMGAVSLLLAMGNSFFLYWFAFKFLPGLNAFRIPGRFAYLFALSVSLLAGTGLTWLQASGPLEKGGRRKIIVERVLLAAAGASVLWAILASAGIFKSGIADFMLASGRFGANAAGLADYVDKQIYPNVVGGVWLFAGLVACAAAILWLRLRGKIAGRTAALFAIAASALDFLAFGFGFAAGTIDPSVMYAKTPAIQQLQDMEKTEYFRINSRNSNPGTDDLGGPAMVFRKNQGSVHRLFLIEGYNPLRLRRELVDRRDRTLDILNVGLKIAVDDRGQMSLVAHPTYFPRCRMVYNYIVEPEEERILPLLYSPGFDHRKSVILEERPAAAIDTVQEDTAWKCRIVNYTLNRIDLDVSTARSGLLVLSEIHYPSWKATVDDRPAPLYRADFALRAIPVGQGHHTVSCIFSREVFNRGLFVSLLSLMLSLALGVWGLLRRDGCGRAGAQG
ncbi:MAG TPA: hypothetical protein VKF42_12065, partial [Chitinivibrionales bacterium]|nr:hypothetical protein [Chitinivibrionales bacterium]